MAAAATRCRGRRLRRQTLQVMRLQQLQAAIRLLSNDRVTGGCQCLWAVEAGEHRRLGGGGGGAEADGGRGGGGGPRRPSAMMGEVLAAYNVTLQLEEARVRLGRKS